MTMDAHTSMFRESMDYDSGIPKFQVLADGNVTILIILFSLPISPMHMYGYTNVIRHQQFTRPSLLFVYHLGSGSD